jgi:hypothetical protein
MTPTHTNKKGVRYSYYVSQAALRKSPGPVGRAPAPELEAAVVDTIRRHLQGDATDPNPIPQTDRELIARHLLRVTLGATQVVIHVRQDGAGSEPAADDLTGAGADTTAVTLASPWTIPAASPLKGIAHVPAHNTPMKPGRRELLLIAIAKARKWIKDAERGHSFAATARREGKAERHIRHLVVLAFVSPRIITAIMDGTASAELTVTALASRTVFLGGAGTIDKSAAIALREPTPRKTYATETEFPITSQNSSQSPRPMDEQLKGGYARRPHPACWRPGSRSGSWPSFWTSWLTNA